VDGHLHIDDANSRIKAAIYLRVSIEEQRERQSIETQRDFARRYCEMHQIPAAGVYSNDGVSGTIALGDRQEGRRLPREPASSTWCSSTGSTASDETPLLTWTPRGNSKPLACSSRA
jgi:hypothetical protein